MLIALIKGSNHQLSTNLNQSEFDCRCNNAHCHQTLIHEDVIQNFQAMRDEYGYAIHVTSGMRCQEHNKKVGGKHNSRHQSGFAIDVTAERLHELYDIGKKYFDRAILYEKANFVHFHVERYSSDDICQE